MDWNQISTHGLYEASQAPNSSMVKYWLGFVDAAEAVAAGKDYDEGDVFSIYSTVRDGDSKWERGAKEWMEQQYGSMLAEFGVVVTAFTDELRNRLPRSL